MHTESKAVSNYWYSEGSIRWVQLPSSPPYSDGRGSLTVIMIVGLFFCLLGFSRARSETMFSAEKWKMHTKDKKVHTKMHTRNSVRSFSDNLKCESEVMQNDWGRRSSSYVAKALSAMWNWEGCTQIIAGSYQIGGDFNEKIFLIN